MKYITYYDSLDHLFNIIETLTITNLLKISQKMKAWNLTRSSSIQNQWNNIVNTVISKKQDTMNLSVVISLYPPDFVFIPSIIKQLEFQTEFPYEIILVCSGASDKTNINVNTNKLNVKIIKIPEINHPGINRNIGASKTTGDYIVFIDSDDIINPELINTCAYLINKYRPDLLIYSYFIDFHSYNFKKINCEQINIVNKTQLFNETFGNPPQRNYKNTTNIYGADFPVTHGYIVCKKTIFETIKYSNLKYGEDGEFCQNVLWNNYNVIAADCQLVNYINDKNQALKMSQQYMDNTQTYMTISDYQFDEKEIITTDKYLQIAKENQNRINYIKTDVFQNNHQISWRGVQHPNIFPPPKKDILITGHSDYTIDRNIYERYKHLSNHWYGVNMSLDSQYDKVITKLPLGITNYCDDSNIHKIYGNTFIMKQISDEEIIKSKSKTIYMNMNIQNFASERNIVNKIFSNKSYVTTGSIDNSIEGRANFLRDIKAHKFVLCPRGNGIDTHRLWETLYMKSIPIVRYESVYSNFKDLPILFIDSWEQIENYDVDKYNQIYDTYMEQKWNMNKLNISYWKNILIN